MLTYIFMTTLLSCEACLVLVPGQKYEAVSPFGSAGINFCVKNVGDEPDGIGWEDPMHYQATHPGMRGAFKLGKNIRLCNQAAQS